MSAEDRSTAYDPYDPEVRRDPYPYYDALRERCPVHHLDRLNLYTVSRYQSVVDLFRRNDLYKSGDGPGPEPFEAIAALGLAALANADEPVHAKQRKLVNWAYTPRRVASLEPKVEGISHELLNAFCQRGSAEWVGEYAVPFHIGVAAELFGVPVSDRERLKDWTARLVEGLTGDEEKMGGAIESMMEFSAYILDHAGQRQAILDAGGEPPDDLLTALVRAEVDGERLDQMELVMIAMQVLNGGESTVSMLANMVYLLGTHPEERAKLTADPSLVENVVEEVLRYDPPIQGLCRTTTTDVDRDGVAIAAGTRVCGLFGSANRDPEYWGPDADRFRIDRDLRQLRSHLSFGFGIHFCLGASLARLEGRIALRHLLDRLGDFIVDGTQPPVLRDPPLFFRGWHTMPIRFTCSPVRVLQTATEPIGA